MRCTESALSFDIKIIRITSEDRFSFCVSAYLRTIHVIIGGIIMGQCLYLNVFNIHKMIRESEKSKSSSLPPDHLPKGVGIIFSFVLLIPKTYQYLS